MKIVADKDIPHLEELLGHDHEIELIKLPGRQITRGSLKQADGLLVRSITHVNEALLQNTPIKWVGSLTAGIDHLDTHWLQTQGIAWRACPGFNAPPVADYVVATLAALINQGMLHANNKQAAVIGVGHVGSLIVKRLTTLGFDMTLIDPLRAANEPGFRKATLAGIHDMDLICVHTPLTKLGEHATYHMINSAFMQRQKAGCVLLNAARGTVIDTHALLSHGKHLITCLDVFPHEPAIQVPVLNATTIATPHIAGHSIESKWRGVTSLINWLKNKVNHTDNVTTEKDLHRVKVPLPCHSWHAIIQHVFDVMEISNEMHDVLNAADDMRHAFDDIRKKYGQRHEFSNTVLMNIEHVSMQDKRILKALGLLFASI
jgi:erythronate-4-phosphate dehydrogenase